MNKLSIIIMSLCCILFVAAFFYFTNMLNEPDTEAVHAASTLPTIAIQGMSLKEPLKKKDYSIILSARESNVYHTSQTLNCRDAACQLLHKNNQIAHLLAAESLVNRTKKEAHFMGPVSGSFKELSFTGSDITYNFSTQHIITDKKITYTHEQFMLSAEKSDFDLNTQQIEMEGVISEFVYGKPKAQY